MLSIQALAALKLSHSRKALIGAFEATPTDKQDWKPSDGKARSARQIMAECAVTNTTFAEMLRSGTEPDLDWHGELAKFEAAEPSALVEQFRAGNEALGAVIESLNDEQLMQSFLWPWAGREVSFAEFALIPAWHNDYHAGQINYTQTLYGDGNDHSAPA